MIHLQQILGGKIFFFCLKIMRSILFLVFLELQIRIHFQGEETMGSPVAVGWSVLYTQHKELTRSHDSALLPFITVSRSRIHYLPSSTPSMTEWEAEVRRGERTYRKIGFDGKSPVLWLHVTGLFPWYQESLHRDTVKLPDVHLLKLRSKSFTNIRAIFAQMQQVCCNPHIKVA